MYVLKNLYNDDCFYLYFRGVYDVDEQQPVFDTEEPSSEEIILLDPEETKETEIASNTDAMQKSDVVTSLNNIYVCLVLFLFFYILFNFKAVIHRSFYNNTKEIK